MPPTRRRHTWPVRRIWNAKLGNLAPRRSCRAAYLLSKHLRNPSKTKHRWQPPRATWKLCLYWGHLYRSQLPCQPAQSPKPELRAKSEALKRNPPRAHPKVEPSDLKSGILKGLAPATSDTGHKDKSLCPMLRVGFCLLCCPASA